MSSPSEATASEYVVGGRYLNARRKLPLTVRYIGPLPNTDTLWIGVEYDDPKHGKHSGEYLGNSIFYTTQPGAGAFIKHPPGTSPLQPGLDLIDAVQERYGSLDVEQSPHGGSAMPAIAQLGDSGIPIEAPGMEDVEKRLNNLERLSMLGLDGKWIARLGGNDRQRSVFAERLKNVHQLDLSENLITSWRDVIEIASHLPGLATLDLSHSRIDASSLPASEEDREAAKTAFKSISRLILGDAALTWADAVDIASLFPELQMLYLTDNKGIAELSLRHDQSVDEAMHKVHELWLDGCGVHSWATVASSLSGLPKLTTLHLANNPISDITPRENAAAFRSLHSLSLGETRISKWTDIDHLNDWIDSQLRDFKISYAGVKDDVDADPLLMSHNFDTDRPFIIAKLPALTWLNGSRVFANDRKDAELHYIHYVQRLPEEQRNSWGQYSALVKKHDTGPQTSAFQTAETKTQTLKSKMISGSCAPVTLLTPDLTVIVPGGKTHPFRGLATQTVAAAQKRLGRQLKTSPGTLWTAHRDSEDPSAEWEPVEQMDEAQELGYYVADSDTVLLVQQ